MDIGVKTPRARGLRSKRVSLDRLDQLRLVAGFNSLLQPCIDVLVLLRVSLAYEVTYKAAMQVRRFVSASFDAQSLWQATWSSMRMHACASLHAARVAISSSFASFA
jgi:hypothetical protein